ncbi:MAG: dUTP diphosphatase [Cetobacterium sp.]|uniref:dUTP diphosphatase n=1 Tax=Cetobacterium sp. TaxID=2071632 RepID=UPI003EE7818E
MISKFMRLQKILDANMVHIRERNEIDIRQSALAECTELNEEMKPEFRHKTWKPKEYNREDEKKELIDILFFIVQMIMLEKPSADMIESYSSLLNHSVYREVKVSPVVALMRVQNALSSSVATLGSILFNYGELCSTLDVGMAELERLYEEKFKYNMKREDFAR